MCAILASRKSNEKSHFNSNHSWISPFVLYEFIFLLFKCRLSKLELPNGFFFSKFRGKFITFGHSFQSWMDKKRVFGNATVFCGIPLGAMILSPLWAYLNELFSWRGTCLIQAGLSGTILMILGVFLQNETKSI